MPDSLSLSGISYLYQSAFNQYSSSLKKNLKYEYQLIT